MKSPRLITAEAVLSFVVTILIAGCAQNPDVRGSHDYTSGTTAMSPPDYLVCVQSELDAATHTYVTGESDSLKLYVDSTDPNKATGLVEVRGAGKNHQFSAYQKDAWYDHGRLLDAALLCSRA
ncbi:hypothetical protein [Pseudomonas putida]